MLQLLSVEAPKPVPSPLMLCDRLLSLAEDADRAGCSYTAQHLLKLAFKVCEERPTVA